MARVTQAALLDEVARRQHAVQNLQWEKDRSKRDMDTLMEQLRRSNEALSASVLSEREARLELKLANQTIVKIIQEKQA